MVVGCVDSKDVARLLGRGIAHSALVDTRCKTFHMTFRLMSDYVHRDGRRKTRWLEQTWAYYRGDW